MKADIVITGAGYLGNAIAWKLSKQHPDKVIAVLEKNKSVASDNQSGRSSGVNHSGIYYSYSVQPLKAKHCPIGNAKNWEFCEKYGAAHKRTGKLVVATNQLDCANLETVVKTARENGVPFRKLTRKQAKALEPNVECVEALYFPTSGVLDPVEMMQIMQGMAKQNGVLYAFNNEVVGVEPSNSSSDSGFVVEVVAEENGKQQSYRFETEILINAAGLASAKIAKMANPDSPYEILPSRGESAKFYCTARPELDVSMNVYPAPCAYDPATGEIVEKPLVELEDELNSGQLIKTVGIHLTPLLDGRTITIGPAKNKPLGEDDFSTGLREPEYFHQQAVSYFPGLKLDDIQLHQAGIMAVPKGHRDWIFERDPKYSGLLNLIGFDSPGISGGLSIAEEVDDLLF